MKHRQRARLADATALLGGLLFAFAFAPFGWRILLPISLGALFFSVVLTTQSHKRAFLRGFLWGLGAFGVGVSWVYYSMHDFGGASVAAAGAFTLVLVMYLALFPAMALALAHRFFHPQHPQATALTLALCFCVFEWLRTWLLTGFGWLLSGHALLDTPLAGLMPYIGSLGSSFVLLWLTASAVLILRDFQLKKALIFGGFLLAVLGLGVYLNSRPRADLPSIDVAVVQGNVPQQLKLDPKYLQKSLQTYWQLSVPVLGADVILWPETAVPTDGAAVAPFLNQVAALGEKHHSQFLTGIFRDAGNGRDYYNSLIEIGSAQHYDKRQLVPFGEYMPIRWLLDLFSYFVEIPQSDLSRGSAAQAPFQLHSQQAGAFALAAQICYESTYPDVIGNGLQNAQIWANVSNDAWFGNSLAPHQHLEITRVRAREFARAIARATNNGISALIDERGEVTYATRQFTATSLRATLPLNHQSTLFSQIGQQNIGSILCLCLLVLLFANWRAAQNFQPQPDNSHDDT